MAFIGADDILILQKNDGQVRRVIAGVLQPAPVLEVAVNQLSERGLLGIALHPTFPSTLWVYLYYSAPVSGGISQGLLTSR
jgi:aldose sugar dehydrogenase